MNHESQARPPLGLLASIAMILLWLAPAAKAQGPLQVSVSLPHDRVAVGDSFIYRVTIDGASAVQEPAFPESDAYKAVYLGGRDESSHSIFTINGKTTESSTLRFSMAWQITPQKPGQATIGSFQIKAGSQTATVPATSYIAAEANKSPYFRLTLEPSKTDAYVGEPIHMKLVWSLGRNARGPAFTGPDGGNDFDVLALDPRPPKARSVPTQGSDAYYTLPFLDGQFVAARSHITRDGQEVPALVAELVITPRRAGDVQVGPYRVAFDEVVGQRERTWMDAPWDDLSQTRRSVVSSDVVTLHVKPLPKEGRPADFSGLIGDYSIEASAGATEANVGDPIPLTLTIRGPEPLNSVKPPTLDSQPALSSRFKAAPEGWELAAADKAGQRTFTTTIRPKNDSVTQIPAIGLPFFNTASGKYDLAMTSPLPLTVHPSKEVTLADAMRPGAVAGPSLPTSSEPASLTDAPGGIGANTESLDALVNQQVSVIAMLQTPGGITFIAAPPAALAFVGLLAYRRKTRDPRAVARRGALAAGRREVRAAASDAALYRALQNTLSPFIGAEARSITSADARAGLAGPAADEASDLLSDLEAASFSERPVKLAAAKQRAGHLLETLGGGR
jgi:hypothetical protein